MAKEKASKTWAPAKAKPAKVVYQFRITLLGINPKIWRRIQIKDCFLEDLHGHIPGPLDAVLPNPVRLTDGGVVGRSQITLLLADSFHRDEIGPKCGTRQSRVGRKLLQTPHVIVEQNDVGVLFDYRDDLPQAVLIAV